MNNKVYYNNGGGDEQLTQDYGVEIILNHIEHHKGKIIWCPFDKEDSAFVRVLKNAGHRVVFSHIENGQDFFNYEPEKWDLIISNSPFTKKRSFWERCLALGKPFALLLPVNILSDSMISRTIEGRKLQLLIPDKRMRFLNSKTKEIGKAPTFKAVYFGVGIFKEQIIFENINTG